jgi:hypothetical protein
MATSYPLDYELETGQGQFRIITNSNQGAYATTIYRRLPDGPHTEVYREQAATQQEAQATHDRIVEAVKGGTLP